MHLAIGAAAKLVVRAVGAFADGDVLAPDLPRLDVWQVGQLPFAAERGQLLGMLRPLHVLWTPLGWLHISMVSAATQKLGAKACETGRSF